MRTENIFKAQPITDNMPVESVTILIDETLPEIPRYLSQCCCAPVENIDASKVCKECNQPCEQFDNSRWLLECSAERFDEQAALLANALFDTLPQGVLDRVLVEFMRRRVSGYYGIDDVPLGRKLINWLESKKQTVELCYREGEGWSIETLLGNRFSSENGSLQGALMHGYLHDRKLSEVNNGNS